MYGLRDLRCKANLTQDELASQVSLTQGCIGHYETGKRTPSITQAMKIIKVLQAHNVNCSVEELFGIETQKAS